MVKHFVVFHEQLKKNINKNLFKQCLKLQQQGECSTNVLGHFSEVGALSYDNVFLEQLVLY